jgi:hypothetical protein
MRAEAKQGALVDAKNDRNHRHALALNGPKKGAEKSLA